MEVEPSGGVRIQAEPTTSILDASLDVSIPPCSSAGATLVALRAELWTRKRMLAVGIGPCLFEPVLHGQTRHAAEVPDVASDYRQASREPDRRDTSVRLTYGNPYPFELSANTPVDFSSRSIERQYRNVWPDASLKLAEQLVPPSTSVGTVNHLADCDRRCELVLERSGRQAGNERRRRASPQNLTERVCVEQVHYQSSETTRSAASERWR